MITISDGAYDMVPYFLMVKIISPIISNFWINPIITKLARRTSHAFNCENIKKYDSMSFETKNNKTSTIFWQHKEAANRSVYLMIEWGLPNVMNLFGTICGVIWTFIQKKLLIELCIILTVCTFLYYTFIRNKQNAYTILDKILKKAVAKINSKIQLDLIPFQYKEYDTQHIISRCL